LGSVAAWSWKIGLTLHLRVWLSGREAITWLEWMVLWVVTLKMVWISRVSYRGLGHVMSHNLLVTVLGVWIHRCLVLRVRLREDVLRARILSWHWQSGTLEIIDCWNLSQRMFNLRLELSEAEVRRVFS